MLPLTNAAKLWQEFDVARRFTEDRLARMREIEGMMFSGHYTNRWQADMGAPDNHPFEYSAAVLPKMVYDDPQVRASSDDVGAYGLAKGLASVINKWSRATKVRKDLALIAQDMINGWGVSMVEVEADPMAPRGADLTLLRPRLRWIAPRRFIVDPKADSIEDARFAGVMKVYDKDDLIQRAQRSKKEGWDVEQIRGLVEDADLDKFRDDKGDEGPNRKEVLIYEVWIPEADTDLDDRQFNGMIYTVGTAAKPNNQEHVEGRFIRKPRPFFGPAYGPFNVFGAYWKGGLIYPLSPVAAVWDKVLDLNVYTEALAKAASQYKSGAFFDGSSKDLKKALAGFKNGDAVGVPNFDKSQIQQVQIGGTTNEMITQYQMRAESLFRASGMDEAQRGQVEASATATAVAEAAAASAGRVEYIVKQFVDTVDSAYETVGWYMFHSQFFQGRIPPNNDFPQGGMFHGGLAEGEQDVFDDLGIHIESKSVGHISDAILQKRTLEKLDRLIQMAPIIAQAPYMRWGNILDDVGNALNEPGYGQYIDLQMAMQSAEAIAGTTQPETQQIPLTRHQTQDKIPLLGNETGSVQSEARRVA